MSAAYLLTAMAERAAAVVLMGHCMSPADSAWPDGVVRQPFKNLMARDADDKSAYGGKMMAATPDKTSRRAILILRHERP